MAGFLKKHFSKKGIQMGKKNMKLCSASLNKRNIDQNYNEVSPHTSQNGHHQKSTNNKCWKGCEGKGTSSTVGGDVNWCSHYGKTGWRFLRKVKIELLYDPAITLLGMYLEKTLI